MLTVIAITLPIFLVVGLGFATTRAGLFSPIDMRIFGRFVITIALPALLFTAIAKRDVAEVFDPGFMGLYAGASLLVVAVGYVWFHRIQGMTLDRAGTCIMGMACSNSGYMAFPILSLALPDLAPVVLAMSLLVENLLMIPTCLILIAMGKGDGAVRPVQMLARIGADLIRRPLILALIAGLVWSLFGFPLPTALDRAATMIATSSIALALFVIGGSLAGVAFRGNMALAVKIMAGKLFLHPAMGMLVLTLAALAGFSLTPDLRASLLIATAVPMLGVYPIFAQEQDMEGLAALAMLITTAASFFTLSLALALLL